ncbi:MAG TPA: hypothetical protein VGX92_03890 [Pyrinomonadaceae bacterium]|nr:hypothetical protein [Pyrinomonadaceae bacterium]
MRLIFCLGVSLSLCAAEVALAQTPNQSRPRHAGTTPQQPPPTPPAPAAEATVTLNEPFLNALLEAMFTQLGPPSFPLSLAAYERPAVKPPATIEPPTGARAAAASVSQCGSVVVLEREMDGVKTAVHFENGRIVAPLAFSGSYSVVLLGCMRFQGWAETVIHLNFDRERQVLSARVDVQDIHLSGIPSLANGVVINLVQNSLDSRINPVEILQSAQLTARLPISAAGGALRLRAKEVRPEILQGSLRLHIIYEFIRDK